MFEVYTTDSCSQCPIVLSALEQRGADFYLINAEESPEKAAEHGIMSVPTIVDHEGNTHTGTAACLAFINSADF